MAQRKNPRTSLVSSCITLLESVAMCCDKASKALRGAAKAGRDAQAAYEGLRSVGALAVHLLSSAIVFFSRSGTARTC